MKNCDSSFKRFQYSNSIYTIEFSQGSRRFKFRDFIRYTPAMTLESVVGNFLPEIGKWKDDTKGEIVNYNNYNNKEILNKWVKRCEYDTINLLKVVQRFNKQISEGDKLSTFNGMSLPGLAYGKFINENKEINKKMIIPNYSQYKLIINSYRGGVCDVFTLNE